MNTISCFYDSWHCAVFPFFVFSVLYFDSNETREHDHRVIASLLLPQIIKEVASKCSNVVNHNPHKGLLSLKIRQSIQIHASSGGFRAHKELE